MTAAYEGQGASADRGLLPDGRRLWVFSQSQLKQVDVCPERGRRSLLNLMPRYNTDSTAIGHAVHSVIEMCLSDVIAEQGAWNPNDMVALACELFDEEMADPTAQWVKDKRPHTVHNKIGRCVETWYGQVLPTLSPLAVEVTFGPLTLHEDDEHVIQVQGQIDYVDAVDGLADWKTSGGRRWEEWEHKRWDIQPTLYTWAESRDTDVSVPFTWHVLNVNGDYQRIETTRGPADWAWLATRAVNVAKLLEAELPQWQLNDTTALCSPKFCGAWASCKGAHMPSTWPKTP